MTRYIMDAPSEGQRIEQKTNRTLTASQLTSAGATAGSRVLDLGCAAGTTSRILAGIVGPSGGVVGVDASTGRIAEACAHAGHVSQQAGFGERRSGRPGA